MTLSTASHQAIRFLRNETNEPQQTFSKPNFFSKLNKDQRPLPSFIDSVLKKNANSTEYSKGKWSVAASLTEIVRTVNLFAAEANRLRLPSVKNKLTKLIAGIWLETSATKFRQPISGSVAEGTEDTTVSSSSKL